MRAILIQQKHTNKTDFDAKELTANIITYPNPTKGLFTVEVPNYWLDKDTTIEMDMEPIMQQKSEIDKPTQETLENFLYDLIT